MNNDCIDIDKQLPKLGQEVLLNGTESYSFGFKKTTFPFKAHIVPACLEGETDKELEESIKKHGFYFSDGEACYVKALVTHWKPV